jgi:hypothetical protein
MKMIVKLKNLNQNSFEHLEHSEFLMYFYYFSIKHVKIENSEWNLSKKCKLLNVNSVDIINSTVAVNEKHFY